MDNEAGKIIMPSSGRMETDVWLEMEIWPVAMWWHNILSAVHQNQVMNIKRIFGSILTILGIAGLIYGAVLFVNMSGGLRDVRALIIYGILGLIFLISGIGLVRTTRDEA